MAARSARSGRISPRLELLEARALLAGDGLLIGFEAGTSAALASALISRLRPIAQQAFDGGPVYVEPGPGVDVGRARIWLESRPAVRYIEADSEIAVEAASIVRPGDPLFGLQWGLDNPANDVDINAPEAWSTTTGSASTIVAVIDSGLDLGRPDFYGRIWVNAAEYGGRPGVDDDRDGYVDDYFGWNFRDNNMDLTDTADHGTHVTSILAASGGDGVGVAGVNWQAKIMPLKFMGADGKGSISDAVRAIYFAVNHGARVINASWGTSDYSRSLDDVIGYAARAGVVFVTAAGNESANNDLTPSYPALNRHENTLSVAAIDRDGGLAGFSNYGTTAVDIAAPGVSIRGDVPGGSANYSGTSMATPFVAGVASLVLARHPNWTAAQVVRQILATARPLPTLTGLVATGGIVDAAAAVGASADGASPSSTGLPADPTGVAAATARGDTLRAEIMASPEYFQVHGGTVAGYLDGVYRTALDRPVAPSEVELWASKLASGANRAQVAAEILGSVEARRTKIAHWFIDHLGWGESLEFLKNYGPVAEWADRLVGGEGDSSIRSLILGSQEFYNRSGGLDATFLDALYRAVDDRPPTAAEVGVWRQYLRDGMSRETVSLLVQTAPEARRLRVARWYVEDLRRSTPLATLVTEPDVIGWASRISD